ncbi:MAG TPA: hypothetical protein VFS43_36700 [Polyangiaceae bacterium]|nr:hypothetical protein [Polyangiaceae bacterium]
MSEREPKPPAFPPWPKGLDLTALPSLSDEARAVMGMTQQSFQAFTSWAESVLTSPNPSDEEFERVVALFTPFDTLARRVLQALVTHMRSAGSEAELLQAAAELESFVWSYVPAETKASS